MARTSYAAAVQWIADNDDTTWIDDEDPIPCITVSMVADLWGKDEEQVICDLRKALAPFDPIRAIRGLVAL